MTGNDLTVVIDTMDEERVESLLRMFAEVELIISRPPRTGLVMMAVHDSFATAFHPGEILVTEARVVFHGTEGFGMVLGEAPRRALARAACDALLHCPEALPIKDQLRLFLSEEAVGQKAGQMETAALIGATKVNFDLMPGA